MPEYHSKSRPTFGANALDERLLEIVRASRPENLGEKGAYTCSQLARFLSVHPSTLQRWRDAATGPP